MAHADRDWSQLPKPVLGNLMQKAGRSGRHGRHCLALVCTSWAEAVAAQDALEDELCINGCTSIDNFQCWLIKHGHQLHKFTVQSVKGLSVLPCPQLQCLSLHSCDLDFRGGSSAFCDSISTATALTSLHINNCRLVVDSATTGAAEAAQDHMLSALAPLTALQSLCIYGSGVLPEDQASTALASCKPSDGWQHLTLNAAALQPLQCLTQLHLQLASFWYSEGGFIGYDKDAVQHIGTMTDLQDLCLGSLQQGPEAFERGKVVYVTQLTALTKLQRLALRGVTLGASMAAALLAWLPTMTALSSLQLRAVQELCPEPELHNFWSLDYDEIAGAYAREFPAATAYSALTASSNLQHIDLRGTVFSKDAWQSTFPLEPTLASITSMRIGFTASSKPCSLESAVCSCPNLRELQTEQCTLRWQLLQQHTGLTRLTVRVGKDSFPWQLGRLKELRSLKLLGLRKQSLKAMLYDLQQLAPLTQLSFLGLEGSIRDSGDAAVWDSVAGAGLLGLEAAGCDWAFVSQAPRGSPPDVSSQLQAAMARAAELAAGGSTVTTGPARRPTT